jgi:hypothetical protein
MTRPCPRCARRTRWLGALCADGFASHRRMVSACCYAPLPWRANDRVARARRERLTNELEDPAL